MGQASLWDIKFEDNKSLVGLSCGEIEESETILGALGEQFTGLVPAASLAMTIYPTFTNQ